ncbi:hypothetical protein ARC20_03190 [Stenotrophomonas panacihumi]|uniref:Uncharacterized protein n=1 Tax=Stenotrophomonas panacihumi TaxID=676599 RepID=A0A0R0AQD6_9GAMM|nr:hypothetical protein [Stenotrophomonas panacihumi]KRG47349.1 hypothetical protein ARC20_03190 [Stenotrophomonas panacihumi]PTN55826.1 hypothetical protein C9J98_04430 [Stenotrophomonas panacihumi]
MQIINKHATPLGLPSGQVLVPEVPAPVPDWATLKKNAVVQAWIAAGILIEGKDSAKAAIIGTRNLPADVPLIEDKVTDLDDLVRQAFEASGLELEAWNSLTQADRDSHIGSQLAELKAEAAAPSTEEEKAELIAQLEAAKVKFDKRWGVEKLRAALDEAQKAAAGGTGS